MNPKTAAILFVIAAALAAFVHFYEIGGEEARKGAEEAEKRLFPKVEQAAVESISLIASDGPSVLVERREGAWRLIEPLDFAADTFAVDGIASALAQMASESVIDEPRPAEVYGLDAEDTVVHFTAGGSEYALRTGDSTPVGANVYAAIEGDDRVYTVAAYRTQSLRKPLDELRDKRIADFDQSAVKRFTASWPTGRVVVERSGEGWHLLEPVQEAADNEAVDGLLSGLVFLRAEGFVDDPAPELEAGFEVPEFAIEIELSIVAADAGQAPAPLRVAVGGLNDSGTHRLVKGAAQSLFTIASARLDEFPRSVVEYRDRQLGLFSPALATRVELGFHSDLGVTTAVTARRGAEGWTSSPDPISEEKLASLVAELSRLRADGIIAEAMGTDELQAIGLDPPKAIISVFGDSAAEGEGGAPLLVELQLGSIRAEGIPARTPQRETVFELNGVLAEQIPVSLEAFRNYFVSQPEPEPEPEVGSGLNDEMAFEFDEIAEPE